MTSREIANIRKKRDIVCRSIATIGMQLADIEGKTDHKDSNHHLQRLDEKLHTLHNQARQPETTTNTDVKRTVCTSQAIRLSDILLIYFQVTVH